VSTASASSLNAPARFAALSSTVVPTTRSTVNVTPPLMGQVFVLGINIVMSWLHATLRLTARPTRYAWSIAAAQLTCACRLFVIIVRLS
jgi:hypothetical protein